MNFLNIHSVKTRPLAIFVAVASMMIVMSSPADAQESDVPTQEKTSTNSTQLEEKQLRAVHPVELDYLLSLPSEYESQKEWPLVLFLHGAGERGDDLDKVKVHGPPKLVQAGKAFPFILVAPQCPADRWWEPITLTALLDEIESKYNVDKDRVYVTGLSMGGFGTWNLAAHTPERFAAIVPICGGGDSFVVPRRIRNRIPIWAFHGDKDNVVPVKRTQDLADAFKRFNVEIKFTSYPGVGHDSWTETYNNEKLYEWMLAQRRGGSDDSEKESKADK
ncbi:MAG: dienelactone hydrolase family protein [Planctomycetota bacterium]